MAYRVASCRTEEKGAAVFLNFGFQRRASHRVFESLKPNITASVAFVIGSDNCRYLHALCNATLASVRLADSLRAPGIK